MMRGVGERVVRKPAITIRRGIPGERAGIAWYRESGNRVPRMDI